MVATTVLSSTSPSGRDRHDRMIRMGGLELGGLSLERCVVITVAGIRGLSPSRNRGPFGACGEILTRELVSKPSDMMWTR